jgi:large subunit ribosomal protein L13
MLTSSPKLTDIHRAWHLIDLDGQTLGRQSTKIAKLLMGKDKTYYTANLDCGDYVVIINAQKVHLTGNKGIGKIYRHHTGFPGGFKEYDLNQMMAKDPRTVVSISVKGMLPKNKLRDLRMKRLKVFIDGKHPYAHHFNSPKTTSSQTE